MTEPGIDLVVPPLHGLRERRSEKWALFDPDVLSLTIAEMDFPLAPAIRRVPWLERSRPITRMLTAVRR